MRRLALSFFLTFLFSAAGAQTADNTAFKGYLENQEYNVYMRINFYEQDVVISWQEMFGQLPGFLSKHDNNYCWIITDATIDGNKAELELVNDYGSEDLKATLTQENDSVFVLRQRSGSNIKVPNKGKWQKLPGTLTFLKRKTGK